MRNLLFFSIFFLVSNSILSQEKRKLIKGNIKLDSLPVNDVHVINMNSQLGTISNDLGNFEISVKLGDTLTISHINLKSKSITVSKNHLLSQKIIIALNEEVTLLNGFTLQKQRSIFYVDPTIKTYNGPVVNAKTLKLPYANTKVKPNNSIVSLNSGGVISLGNLVNSLNGNKRRKRIVEKLTKEDRLLLKIRKHFTDDFFITDLHIKKENINPFLNFCVQKNILQLFHKKETIKLTKFLMQQSKSFPQKEMSEIKLAYKKD